MIMPVNLMEDKINEMARSIQGDLFIKFVIPYAVLSIAVSYFIVLFL